VVERDVVASGATLMNAGIAINFKNEDFTTNMYYIRQLT